MALTQRPHQRMIRKASPLVSHVAATTPLTQYIVAPGRSAIIRKLLATNRTAAPVTLQIGDGLGGLFVQRIPSIFLVNGIDLELREDDLPCFEFGAGTNITAQVSAAGAAPNDVQAMIEVDEIQGVTG